MLPEQQQRILGYFIEEAKDHLNTIEQGLLNLQATLNDPEMLNEVFRAAHSIKGGAAMLGLNSIQHTAHRLEDCFKILKEHPVQVDQKLESLFLGVSDTLKALLEQLQSPFGLSEEIASDLMSEAEPVFQWLHEHLEILVKEESIKLATNPSETVQTPTITTTETHSSNPSHEERPHGRSAGSLSEDFYNSAKPTPTTHFGMAAAADPKVSKELPLRQSSGTTHSLAALPHNHAAFSNAASSSSPAILIDSDSEQQIQTQVIHTLRDMLQLFRQTATPETRENLQKCCHHLVKLGEEFKWSNWSNLCRVAASAIANPTNSYLTLAKIVITDIKQALELVLTGREAEIAVSQQLESLVPVLELELLEIDVGDEPTTTINEPSNSSESISSTDTVDTVTSPEEALPRTENELLEIQANSITTLSDLSVELNNNSKDELFADSSIGSNCPEVGTVELNTLADLFEGETANLDGWEQVEILDIPSEEVENNLSSTETNNTDSDFQFLFDQETNGHSHQPSPQEEELTLVQLFGDELLEEEKLEIQNSENVGLVIEFSNEYLVDQEDITAPIVSEETASPTNQQEIASIELPVKNENSYDDLVQETDLLNTVQEIADVVLTNVVLVPDEDKISSLEELLIKIPEDPTSASLANQSTSETSDNVLDALSGSTTSVELAEQENDLAQFWNQEISEEPKGELNSIVEEDAARALEEILHAAASDNILGNAEGSIPPGFNLETLDLTLPSQEELNLIFLPETDDNLFEDLPLTNSTTDPGIDNDELSSEILSFSQQPGSFLNLGNQSTAVPPEALELMPEFTNSVPETSQASSKESASEIELDWFHEFEIESHESLPGLFEEIAADDINLKNNSFPQQQQDLGDEFFTLDNQLNLSFTNESQQNQIHQEVVNAETLSNSETNVEVSKKITDYENVDLKNADTELEDILNTESQQKSDDRFRSTDTLDVSIETLLNLIDDEIDDLPYLLTERSKTEEATIVQQENSDFASEIVENEDELLLYIQAQAAQQEQQETVNDTLIEDEFAELDELLTQEVTFGTTASATPEDEMSALEELLNIVPGEVSANSSKADINDQFQELVEMVKGDLAPRMPVTRVPKFEQLMKVPVKHLDDLSNLVGELVVNRNSLEQDQERLRQSLDNLLSQVQQLSDVGARMQELYERSLLEASLLASRKNNGIGSQKDTDRGFSELEMDRFTPFHTLSQEMIELIVRVRESASDIDFVIDETEQVARQFRQVTTQLQEGITRSRMEPFAEISTPLERGVRESAIKCGKQARLVIEGRDTLIDKMILEHLKSPLTHLLNNAISHGIETPAVRQAAGKPPVGVITIRAFHQGNQTVISVSDDGAGINADGVKAKAVKMGLMTAEQVKTMSHIDIYDLLFQPGFSTKEKEDEFAGRGVGLDVVLTRISEIRGTINIDSTLGKGTTFTIRLPLTLSICKALFCVSDKARIAFPMDGVEDTLDIPVKNIQHGSDGQKFIPWRDTVLPLRPLKDLLTFNRQLSRGNVYGGNRDDDMISVVVVRSANTLIALQIDQVLSEQEIVIKQFEGPAPKPIGVAGATILGDGRIMPIADVLEIIDLFQGRISKQRGISLWEQQATPTVPEIPATKIDPTVLIVDDSITVRELLSITFSKAGYRVEQARDGQEAWDKLRSGLPCDIVFCDIEMPRCDGLELLSRIQKDSNLNHLPIAMLTSRGADKHRQMAIQLGASGYFTKPYLEEALLEAAGRMLKGENLVNHSGSNS